MGKKFTKFMQNVSSSRFGWYAAIKMNHDLADSHYIKHYMNTNKSMFMCAPYFGKMFPRVGTQLNMLQYFSHISHDSLS